MSGELSHIDEAGRAKMVDVGEKTATRRVAIAEGRVKISPALQLAIEADTLAKGSLLDVARLAGIMAAKRTDELIPLCHTLPLEHVEVQLAVRDGFVYIRAEAHTTSKTGVEMEAFTAVALAALTVIDMGKAVDAAMVVENIRLVEKSGGRRGTLKPHGSEFPR
jgi:cyclic pyranopterin phosphate synthase